MPNTFVSYEPVDVFRVVHTALYHAPLFAHRVSSYTRDAMVDALTNTHQN